MRVFGPTLLMTVIVAKKPPMMAGTAKEKDKQTIMVAMKIIGTKLLTLPFFKLALLSLALALSLCLRLLIIFANLAVPGH